MPVGVGVAVGAEVLVVDVAVDVEPEVEAVDEVCEVVAEVVGAGVDVGGSGGDGQFARAGLNAVGVGDGVACVVVDVDEVVAVPLGFGVGDGVGVPDGVGVATYGVYEGQLASGGVGGACAPATISETATASAPTRTVATKVTAPHSRLNRLFTRPPSPGRPASRERSRRHRERGARS